MLKIPLTTNLNSSNFDIKELILTLIRLGEGKTPLPWYILLYNVLVTHSNFMKLGDFS